MRIIKFRAWADDEMFNWKELREDYWDTFEAGVDGDKSIILMQYTGLSDKNGNEIYEGDIIKTHHEEFFNKETKNGYNAYDEFGEVVFESRCWMIADKKHGKNNRFYLHSEIIGNIYENPELIK